MLLQSNLYGFVLRMDVIVYIILEEYIAYCRMRIIGRIWERLIFGRQNVQMYCHDLAFLAVSHTHDSLPKNGYAKLICMEISQKLSHKAISRSCAIKLSGNRRPLWLVI